MPPSASLSDPLLSVAQQVRAGHRLMAQLELDPQMSVLGDRASSWLWKAWLAESPEAARSALHKAQKLDPHSRCIAAGITFVQGLLDWQPADIETDFDVDPELLIDPADKAPLAKLDAETDFDVDPECIVDDAGDASAENVESEPGPPSAKEDAADPSASCSDAFTTQHAAAAEAANPSDTEPNPLILAVDDSPTVRNLVSLTLAMAGYQVETAADGTEALDKMATRRPALVLTDVHMPKLDGYRLCKLIKNHPETRDIPVVLLCEDDGLSDKLRRSMVGCRDHLVKPFESSNLTEKVREHAPNRCASEHSVDA